MEERCEHCGAGMKAYWHALTPGLVTVLIKMIGGVKRKNENKIHLQKDLDLTKTEYANFQKLRFHALVAKSDTEGYWVITTRGGKFLRGEMRVPQKVQTFRNKIVQHSEELIGMADYRQRIAWFENDFEYELKHIAGDRVQTNLFSQLITTK